MRSLTKHFRSRAAIFIALAYAFCLLTPSAALAFVNNPTDLHCLAEVIEPVALAKHDGMVHAHADGIVHHHDQKNVPDNHSGSNGKSDDESCCGLFSLSALAHDPGLTFGVEAPASLALPDLANNLAGCGPNRLYRPPIR